MVEPFNRDIWQLIADRLAQRDRANLSGTCRRLRAWLGGPVVELSGECAARVRTALERRGTAADRVGRALQETGMVLAGRSVLRAVLAGDWLQEEYRVVGDLEHFYTKARTAEVKGLLLEIAGPNGQERTRVSMESALRILPEKIEECRDHELAILDMTTAGLGAIMTLYGTREGGAQWTYKVGIVRALRHASLSGQAFWDGRHCYVFDRGTLERRIAVVNPIRSRTIYKIVGANGAPEVIPWQVEARLAWRFRLLGFEVRGLELTERRVTRRTQVGERVTLSGRAANLGDLLEYVKCRGALRLTWKAAEGRLAEIDVDTLDGRAQLGFRPEDLLGEEILLQGEELELQWGERQLAREIYRIDLKPLMVVTTEGGRVTIYFFEGRPLRVISDPPGRGIRYL